MSGTEVKITKVGISGSEVKRVKCHSGHARVRARWAWEQGSTFGSEALRSAHGAPRAEGSSRWPASVALARLAARNPQRQGVRRSKGVDFPHPRTEDDAAGRADHHATTEADDLRVRMELTSARLRKSDSMACKPQAVPSFSDTWRKRSTSASLSKNERETRTRVAGHPAATTAARKSAIPEES